jgi:predicted amidohydrolase YtcJ
MKSKNAVSRSAANVATVLASSLCIAGIAWLAGCSSPPPATLVVEDGRVWTGDETRPWAEAVAITGDRIVAVGSRTEIDRFIGPETQVLSAAGGLVTPGFIDSHVHLVDGGASLASVQLRDAATPAEFSRRIAEFVGEVEPDEWILAGAWDHESWGGELPHRRWIDEATPNNPVAVSRLDGHMLLANSRALELAGVDQATSEVEGGTIVRDADGTPTGILKDNAMNLVLEVIPPPSPATLDRQIDAAQRYLIENGVTTAHDMGEWSHLEAYRRAKNSGRLRLRLYSLVPLATWERLRDDVAVHGRGDEWLRTGGLKGFMDGSLGSHTAAFLDPYTDQPEDRGFLINDLADMRSWVEGADAAGLDIAVHAIGDRAIRDILDIYREVARANGDRDRRFRIEHAQHIHRDDLGRFATQSVIASMQPYHAIDDGRWAEKVIGRERSQTTYAFRALIESGAQVAFGSDWYVAPASAVEGIYAAVTRRTLDGAHPNGWVPEQKLTVAQALTAYTRAGAYASFEEDRKGRLAPGLLGDLVILDRDLTTITPEDLASARVLVTIVGGQVVFEADGP